MMNGKFKKMEMETFVALYIFTVTFDWFNVLLLTKSNHFFKKKHTDRKL